MIVGVIKSPFFGNASQLKVYYLKVIYDKNPLLLLIMLHMEQSNRRGQALMTIIAETRSFHGIISSAILSAH